MHAFWLVLTYDLLEDKRIDDVIIKTFALCFFKMAESFEHNTAERRNLNYLNDILADWVSVLSRIWTVTLYSREKERRTRFSVENDSTKLLEQRLNETQNG